MFYIDSVLEFYITNECNLTCSNCNRYNNYNFTGHYSWNDHASDIQLWSQRLSSRLITIIGGEPTMHPDLDSWVHGICTAWPDTRVMIQSNGTTNTNRDYKKNYPNVGYGVALHSSAMTNKLNKKWPNELFDATEFTECALKDQGTFFTVHDSDTEQAFNACTMSKSHTILNGRLYKCPMVAILPEFRKQYNVVLTDVQDELLYSYKSLAANCSDSELVDFLSSRNDPIEQCRLCPGQHTLSTVTFDSNRKKRSKI